MFRATENNVKNTMKLLLIAALVITTSSQHIADKKCKGVYFGEKYYDIEILKEGLNKVQQLILNRNDNTLYFVFEQIATEFTSAVGYLNINTREVGVLYGLNNASTVAIDQQYNKVYIGGKDGIYKMNNDKTLQRLPVYDNIQSMYFKDVLFYTNRRNEAFMYDGDINSVIELQYAHREKIILDDDHNIFFTEGKDLLRVRLGTRAVNSHERYRANVLTTDADNKPYISTNDGIYTYNKYKYVFDKVSDLTGFKAFTFTKMGEPIYSVADFIIKLNQNPTKCFEHFG